jgi:hypothetical protein
LVLDVGHVVISAHLFGSGIFRLPSSVPSGDPHGPEAQYINERIVPNPEQDKDWITQGLHWRRLGEFTISASFNLLLMRLTGFKVDGKNDWMRSLNT